LRITHNAKLLQSLPTLHQILSEYTKLKIYIDVKEKNNVNLKYLLMYHIAKIYIREKERERERNAKIMRLQFHIDLVIKAFAIQHVSCKTREWKYCAN